MQHKILIFLAPLTLSSLKGELGSRRCRLCIGLQCSQLLFSYFISDNRDVFNFQKPLPLGFEWRATFRVIIEWSVCQEQYLHGLHHRRMIHLPEKKSSRQCTAGWFWRQVYLLASGLESLQISVKQDFQRNLESLQAFWCVLASPALFFWRQEIS